MSDASAGSSRSPRAPASSRPPSGSRSTPRAAQLGQRLAQRVGATELGVAIGRDDQDPCALRFRAARAAASATPGWRRPWRSSITSTTGSSSARARQPAGHGLEQTVPLCLGSELSGAGRSGTSSASWGHSRTRSPACGPSSAPERSGGRWSTKCWRASTNGWYEKPSLRGKMHLEHAKLGRFIQHPQPLRCRQFALRSLEFDRIGAIGALQRTAMRQFQQGRQGRRDGGRREGRLSAHAVSIRFSIRPATISSTSRAISLRSAL